MLSVTCLFIILNFSIWAFCCDNKLSSLQLQVQFKKKKTMSEGGKLG